MRARAALATLLRRLHRGDPGDAAPAAGAPLAQPIRATAFTALACDTTGPDPAADALLAVGAVRIRGDRVVLPERVHEDLRGGDGARERGLDALVALVGDGVVVGYRAAVDLAFLNAALAARGRPPLANPALELRLLERWWRERAALPAGGATLGALAADLGVPRLAARHALDEAVTAALAFLRLVGEVEAAGAVQLHALHREAGV
jgi:DNA polymerase-3 subunit epsilon